MTLAAGLNGPWPAKRSGFYGAHALLTPLAGCPRPCPVNPGFGPQGCRRRLGRCRPGPAGSAPGAGEKAQRPCRCLHSGGCEVGDHGHDGTCIGPHSVADGPAALIITGPARSPACSAADASPAAGSRPGTGGGSASRTGERQSKTRGFAPHAGHWRQNFCAGAPQFFVSEQTSPRHPHSPDLCPQRGPCGRGREPARRPPCGGGRGFAAGLGSHCLRRGTAHGDRPHAAGHPHRQRAAGAARAGRASRGAGPARAGPAPQ